MVGGERYEDWVGFDNRRGGLHFFRAAVGVCEKRKHEKAACNAWKGSALSYRCRCCDNAAWLCRRIYTIEFLGEQH